MGHISLNVVGKCLNLFGEMTGIDTFRTPSDGGAEKCSGSSRHNEKLFFKNCIAKKIFRGRKTAKTRLRNPTSPDKNFSTHKSGLTMTSWVKNKSRDDHD